MKSIFLHTLAALSALLLAGCATTDSRIQENQEVFNGLAPDEQEVIRNGQVNIGFTKEMVYMSLGRANRQYTRHVDQGERDVWSYTDYEFNYERQLVRGRFPFRDQRGNLHYTNDSVWVDVKNRVEFERYRIEFADGKVAAIEEMKKP